MTTILDLLRETVEYREWGWWNAMAVSVVGTFIFTLIVAVGLWSQIRTISRSRSVAGIAVLWMTYSAGMFASGVVYGIHHKSAALVFNCAVFAALHIPIVVALVRLRTWTKTEKVVSVLCVAMPVAIALLPWEEELFLLFGIGSLWSIATQPWQMWRTRTAGVLDPTYIGTQLLSTAFWTVYAFVTGAAALQVLNPLIFLLFLTIIYLWFVYRPGNRGQPTG